MVANAERILFKTLLDGDWEKFKGTSNNNPNAGGGARDLRFNGLTQPQFLTIAHQLFPHATREWREREGRRLIDVYNGIIRYGSAPQQVEGIAFESPTEARKLEWRVTQVSGSHAMANAQPVAGAHQDIVIFAQLPNGELLVEFSTLASVAPVAGQVFTAFIHKVAAHPRRSGNSAVGYLDTVTGDMFHN